jgi:hypothetical protein
MFSISTPRVGPGLVKSATINAGCAGCGSSTPAGIRKDYYYVWAKGFTGLSNHVSVIVIEDTVDTAAELDVATYRLGGCEAL